MILYIFHVYNYLRFIFVLKLVEYLRVAKSSMKNSKTLICDICHTLFEQELIKS